MHLAMALLSLGAQTPALPAAPAADATPIIGPSLEDLLQTEVTSVARKSQRLADTAAAVFVITADDIARSGANSIPELLRLAPGVDAVRISGNRWAVSMRGFNDRFSNKLLVLVNGRNAYNPAFSGVFWETLQLPLEDIQQIEVVRGPGAAAWGTNAVNGVINIITKPASTTHGISMAAGGGSREGSFGELRMGGRVGGSDTHYRFYVKGQDAESLERTDGSDANDAFNESAAGLRVDGYNQSGGAWSVDANLYNTNSSGSVVVPVPTLPFARVQRLGEELDGGDLRSRYTLNQGGGNEFQLQLAYAYSDYRLLSLGGEKRDTFDIDLQQHITTLRGHEIIVGGGYRHSRDQVFDGSQQRFVPHPNTLRIASLFVQDEIQLPGNLNGTLGLRLDDHEYTGVEWQPTARLLWNINTDSSAWLSASRAVRTPSRGERSFAYTLAYMPPGIPITVQGSTALGSEHLYEYELGYRAQLAPRLFADTTGYYHRYSDLRRGGAPQFGPQGIVTQLGNGGRLDLYGQETSLDWRISNAWHLQAAYTYSLLISSQEVPLDASSLPKHLGTLRLGWRPLQTLSVDGVLRHVSRREAPPERPQAGIPAFTTADLVINWQLHPRVELSLVGQDLLDARHAEYSLQTPVLLQSEVPRGGYARLRVQF